MKYWSSQEPQQLGAAYSIQLALRWVSKVGTVKDLEVRLVKRGRYWAKQQLVVSAGNRLGHHNLDQMVCMLHYVVQTYC